MASKCFCKSCEGDQRGLAGPCTAKPFVSTAGMFARPLLGAKFVPVPSTAGNIVAMTLFRDRLYVAFQYGVYRREDDDTWTQILSVGPL